MRKISILVLAVLIISMTMATGCRGPEGPAGPIGLTGETGATGPAGPGEQTTYLFRVAPTLASGTYDASCPAITANNTTGLYSTVTCYIAFDGYTDALMLPLEDIEGDMTTTDYFFSIDAGQVTLAWLNSATTVPAAFDLVVTVVNP
ncbi:collagen-like protein [bacterium]|nr:collagen-like protein [bacterium]